MRGSSRCISMKSDSVYIGAKFFYNSAVVVLFCGVRRGILVQVSVNGVLLVAWHRKYITEATTAVDAVGLLLASAFRLVHCRVWIDLCCPNCNNERTCCWKNWPESSALDSVLSNAYREMLT